MDTLHIHKLMGFGCLVHYGIRFYYRFQYGTMFFNNYDISPLIHLSLSLSSFLFKVPTFRLNSKAIIWKELQLHNIIFTSRSVMMMYHSMFFKEINTIYYIIRLGIIGIHHYLADLVSDKYQNNNKTTTRDIPHDIENKTIVNINKKFYAVSQIVASTNLLLSNKPDNAFAIMFPIQFSTFLMTLVRKGYINNNMWHLLYTLSLTLPYLLNYDKIIEGESNNKKFYLSLLHIIMRLIIKTNKYYNFFIITFAYNYS
jgi:hypothetical protein